MTVLALVVVVVLLLLLLLPLPLLLLLTYSSPTQHCCVSRFTLLSISTEASRAEATQVLA